MRGESSRMRIGVWGKGGALSPSLSRDIPKMRRDQRANRRANEDTLNVQRRSVCESGFLFQANYFQIFTFYFCPFLLPKMDASLLSNQR